MNLLKAIKFCQAVLFSTHGISIYKDGAQDNEIVEEIIPLSIGDIIGEDYVKWAYYGSQYHGT